MLPAAPPTARRAPVGHPPSAASRSPAAAAVAPAAAGRRPAPAATAAAAAAAAAALASGGRRRGRQAAASEAGPSEPSPEAPLTRRLVESAVEEYGAAWVSQDPERIAALFTLDAVYVERAFDRSATFRGRMAIFDYWTTQVVGKQSRIRFRHLPGEMVLDAARRRAMVKWMAEFHNKRRIAEGDRREAEKEVRFVQVAILDFAPDGRYISYLEEYLQSTSGSRYCWPSLELPEERLRSMLRMEPGAYDLPGAACRCEFCGAGFASRNELFRHLRAGGQDGRCGVDPSTGAPYLASSDYDPPSECSRRSRCHVALSVSYDCEAGMDPAASLLRAAEAAFPHEDRSRALPTWAAPPGAARRALLNVVGLRLPKTAEGCSEEELAKRIGLHCGGAVRVLWASAVGLEFNAITRCELQRYEALLPLSLLTSHEGELVSPEEEMAEREWRRAKNRQLRGRMASFREFAAARADEAGKAFPPFRHVRGRLLERPGLHAWCLISMALQPQLPPQAPRRLLAALLAWLRGAGAQARKELGTFYGGAEGDGKVMEVLAPWVFLAEPNMYRYEMKNRRCLCGQNHASERQLALLAERRSELQAVLLADAPARAALEEWAGHLAPCV